jgi:hypothetical protein
MLEDIGINSSSSKEIIVWDSALGNTNCNILGLTVYITGGSTITAPWDTPVGCLIRKGNVASEALLAIETLNIKASSAVITSGFYTNTGGYIAVQYDDLSQITLRSNISSTATEEYVLDSTKKIKRIIVSASGDSAWSWIGYIKLKGVS